MRNSEIWKYETRQFVWLEPAGTHRSELIGRDGAAVEDGEMGLGMGWNEDVWCVEGIT